METRTQTTLATFSKLGTEITLIREEKKFYDENYRVTETQESFFVLSNYPSNLFPLALNYKDADERFTDFVTEYLQAHNRQTIGEMIEEALCSQD